MNTNKAKILGEIKCVGLGVALGTVLGAITVLGAYANYGQNYNDGRPVRVQPVSIESATEFLRTGISGTETLDCKVMYLGRLFTEESEARPSTQLGTYADLECLNGQNRIAQVPGSSSVPGISTWSVQLEPGKSYSVTLERYTGYLAAVPRPLF